MKQVKKMGNTEMDFRTISIISLVCGLSLIGFNFMYFQKQTQIFALVNMIAAAMILGIPIIFKYSEFSKVKKIETIFPRYLRDVSESISTGMTLPQAMNAAAKNDYGVLTPHVKELAAKMEWGIPFETVLTNFSKQTGSKPMRRNIQTIVEAYRSGGTIDTVLRSVSSSLQELERIKKERASSIYAQMINGYLIYIIFLGVMIGLATVLVPAFNSFGTTSQNNLQAVLVDTFRALTVIQGLFAGMAIGKMAEGTLTAGVKHALALTIFGYSAFIIFA